MLQPRYFTQTDIARLAGVSQAAVAAVFGRRKGTARVSLATRERILRAAKKLDYTPHLHARQTRMGRTGTVGMVHSGGTLYVNAARTGEVARFLERAGYQLRIVETAWSGRTVEEIIGILLSERIEGIVLCSNLPGFIPNAHRRLLNAQLPSVSLSGPKVPGIPFVASDVCKGFRDLTRHLLGAGRRRLVFLGRTKVDHASDGDYWKALSRFAGFREAVEEAVDVRWDVCEWQPESAETLGEWGWRVAANYLHSGKEVDAFVCTNDLVAAGVLRACAEGGVKVPAAVAVTGCDGDPFAALGTTPITTIVQDTRKMVEIACSRLVCWIRGQPISADADTTLVPMALALNASSESGMRRVTESPVRP